MAFEWLTSAFSSAAAKKPEDMSFDEARPAFFAAIKKENLGTLEAIAKKFPDALDWENNQGTALYIALASKKFVSFKQLVELGADINKDTPSSSWNLMEHAANSGKKDFVLYMLEQGVKNIGRAEHRARRTKNFDLADMIKRKDIIRAEYLARMPQPAPAPVPAAAPAPEMATETKIGVLSPVQLKKTPDTAAP